MDLCRPTQCLCQSPALEPLGLKPPEGAWMAPAHTRKQDTGSAPGLLPQTTSWYSGHGVRAIPSRKTPRTKAQKSGKVTLKLVRDKQLDSEHDGRS